MKRRGIICVVIIVLLIVAVCAAGVYRRGSRGRTVSEIQTVLQNEGLYLGEIDGIFGAATENAVKRYQENYGLTADGIVGSRTLKAMGLEESAAEDSYDNDLYLLSRIISAEARGEPYLGQLAVGAVIMNRVAHPSFPNTIAGVIYQNGAFSAVVDGQFNQPVSDSAYKAAKDALNGWDPTGGCVYYYNPAKTSNSFMLSKPTITVIGRHYFFK